MRSLTKIEFERIALLSEKSVALTLIEPTATGLEKSIMDATVTVRTYLKSQEIHDYEHQNQGTESKLQVKSYLITPNGVIHSMASLYRPNTKKGDPRIWFKGLGAHAKAGDILAIIAFDKGLYVVNVTKLDFDKLLSGFESNPLKELVNTINHLSRAVADELLLMLNEISAKGPVPAMLRADTAVGRTLETLLGIQINSSKKPDYKGIELKAFRDKRGNRKNLFAQVPDWAVNIPD